MEFMIRELSTATWQDFVNLMSTDTQCADCWCLNHREPAGCATGVAAQLEMQELVRGEKVGGLLAFASAAASAGDVQVASECVGWISIDPMPVLVGHDCQSTARTDANEWSIHCVFVRDGFRGKGISTRLIEAAIEYAKARGAEVVSAFPIPFENRGKFPVGEAEFSGRATTYAKFGFRVDDSANESGHEQKPASHAPRFYQRMELQIR